MQTARWVSSNEFTGLIAAALVLSTVSCGGSDENEFEEIVIAAIVDRSATAPFTSWSDAGALAVTHLNEALQEANKNVRFKLNIVDTQQQSTVAAAAALEQVRTHNAIGIIGDTTGTATALTSLAYDDDPTNDLGVPMVCVTCTGNALNNPNATDSDPVVQATYRDEENWGFRTCNRGAEQTSVLNRIILSKGTNGDVNGDRKLKVSVIALNDASGTGFVSGVEANFTGTVGDNELIVEGVLIDLAEASSPSFNWAAVADKLIDNDTEGGADNDGDPDALMENLNPGFLVELSKALAAKGNTVTFYHAHAFRSNRILTELGSAVNGQQGVSGALFDPDASGETFVTELQKATGNAPAVLDSSMYDAVAVLGLAALAVGGDLSDLSKITGDKVRDALLAINDPAGVTVGIGGGEFAKAIDAFADGSAINYDGASGPVDFDEYGNVVMKLSHYEGKNGAFVDVAIYDCVSDLQTCPKEP